MEERWSGRERVWSLRICKRPSPQVVRQSLKKRSEEPNHIRTCNFLVRHKLSTGLAYNYQHNRPELHVNQSSTPKPRIHKLRESLSPLLSHQIIDSICKNTYLNPPQV
ncbi:hypothetical protein BJ165DRAFT_1454574 [Panaeolus papilionaceus]|nr:hypothetical protein BJ165DRAFT_1454574 [Panaeolus papilionaceus]